MTNPFHSARFLYIRMIWVRIVFKSDATTIRLLLAMSSLLWAIGAFTHPATFISSAYAVLDKLAFGVITPPLWGALFLIHFVGVIWRLGPHRSNFWGLVVNGYGLALWLSVTLALSYTLGGLTVGISPDWALCLFAGWAFIRSGKESDAISP